MSPKALSNNIDSPLGIIPLPYLVPGAMRVPSRRLQVVLRRSQQHFAAIDEKIRALVPAGTQDDVSSWLGEHEQFVHEKKMLIFDAVCELEAHVREHPDTPLKDDVKMLRSKLEFLGQVLGRGYPASKQYCLAVISTLLTILVASECTDKEWSRVQ